MNPDETTELDPVVRDLVVYFLEDLSSRMSRAGCNDFLWPDHMTEADIAHMWSLVCDHWEDDDYPPNPDPPDITMDWMIVSSIVKELGGW